MKGLLHKLCDKLGYEFKDESLLHLALTHRSVSQNNYERLEFLGDALLGMIIAEALYQQFPLLQEGKLSRLRANLVCGSTLSDIAREFDLGDYLHLGVGELKSGGFDRDSILADAFESVLGAMYLDSDFDTCKARVLSWYESRLNDETLLLKLKDPKTELQEYLQARQLPLPSYHIISVEGEAHEQVFTVRCSVDGIPHSTTNSGTTRRKAEQKAAKHLLAWLEQSDE